MMATEKHKWAWLPALPSPRVFSTTCFVSDKLFVIGGCGMDGTAGGQVNFFDFASNAWKTCSAMPTPRAAPAVLAVEDALFAFGGVGADSKACPAAERFDLGAQRWEALPALPEALQGVSALVRADKGLLIGGMAPDGASCASFRCFDPRRAKWQSLPPLPTARSKAGVFLRGDKLFVIGGAVGPVPSGACEVFDFRAFGWLALPQRSRPARIFEAIAPAGDSLLACVGGLRTDVKTGFSADLDLFSPEKEEWSEGPPMPQARGDFAFAPYRGQLLVAGGYANQGQPSDCAFAFDPEAQKWTTLPNTLGLHASCGAASHQELGFCLVGGLARGEGCSKKVEVLREA